MKSMSKICALILSLCMMLPAISGIAVFAGTSDITMTVSTTEAKVNDEITVEIANAEMEFQGMSLKLSFDSNVVECVEMLNADGDDGDDDLFMYYLNSKGKEKAMTPTVGDTIEETNSDETFQFAMMPGEDTTFIEGTVVTLVFSVIAEGDFDFELVKTVVDASGETIDTTVVPVTIAAEEPSCDCSYGTPHEISFPYSETVNSLGDYDHYYKWTAEKDGTLSVVMPFNIHCDIFVAGSTISSGNYTTFTADVSAGDVVILNVYDLGEVEGTWSVSFTEKVVHICSTDTLTKMPGQPATCEVDGWKDYYQCSCGTLYVDDAAVYEIEDLDVWKAVGGDGFLEASGHVWDDTVQYVDNGNGTHTATYTCKNDADHTKTETENHTFNENYVCECQAVKTFGLTFDFNGGIRGGQTSYLIYVHFNNIIDIESLMIMGDCAREGYTLLGYTTVKDDASTLIENGFTMSDVDTTIYALWKDNHTCGAAGTLTHVEAKSATCIATGIVEHYICSCGKIYSDSNAATQISEADTIAPIDSVNGHVWGEAAYTDNGDGTHTASYVCENDASHAKSDAPENHTYVDNKCVCKAERFEGWTKIDNEWYYYNPETYSPVTGIARVPYPTELGYGPDQDSINYAESKGESFIDKTTGLFVFDANGVFQSEKTGLTEYKGDTCYVQRGHIAWHPGLVRVNGELYYFIGDVADGGNKFADGEIYMVRTNGIAGFEEDGIYSFTNGKLSGLNGIVGGKYYTNSQLAIGAGLVKLDDGYIYVRSNGNIAVGEYWVTKTNGLLPARMFTFGEDGYLVTAKDPTVNGIVDGCYYKDGDPYYAGLIEIDGATYYVRSNGQLATGKYYITKTSEYKGDLDAKTGDKFTFGEDGKLIG